MSNFIQHLQSTYTYPDINEHISQYTAGSPISNPEYFIQQYTTLSQQARKNAVKASFDIPYGKTPSQKLDFFAPTAHNTGYVLVFIHGGYWKRLSKNESLFMAQHFQDNGVSVAVLDYTLCPHTTVGGIVQECRNAIAYLVHNHQKLGFEKHKILVCGSSAGGHLATLMGITDWTDYNITDPLCGVVAISGIFDLVPLLRTPINDVIQLTSDTAHRLSPIHHPHSPNCDIVITWGEHETQAFKNQSKAYAKLCYAKLCKAQNNTIITKEIPHKNHFDIVIDMAITDTWLSDACLSFITP